MKTKTRILGVAAIAALIGSTALTSAANSASIPSSPAERAATAALNRGISNRNATAYDRSRLLQVRYEEEMQQYEAQQQQYRARQEIYRNTVLYDAANGDY